MIEALLTGLLLGIGGSLHCVGMCGAIVSALSFSTRNQSFSRASITTLFYNIGRITTYLLLGIIAGLISELGDSLGFLKILRVLAGILMIITGIYLSGWWSGLLAIERVGQPLWARVKPFTQKLNPAQSMIHALLTGMIWGLIPCGLVYSALGIATAQGSVSSSVIFMMAFGLGTLGPVLLMGIGFTSIAQWLKKSFVRISLSLLLILMGSWGLYTAWAHGNHSEHQQNNSHEHHLNHH